MGCNWFVLVQRVCVSVIQCCTEWTVFCVVIGVYWYSEYVCLLYSASLTKRCDVL